MRILVTGSSGFVGSYLVDTLTAAGHDVIALSRQAASSPSTSSSTPATSSPASTPSASPHVTALAGDVTDASSLEACAQTLADTPIDAVIHLVGIIREKGTATFERVHVEGTRNVIAFTKQLGVRRFLHMSALGSALDSESSYFSSKARAETLVRQAGLAATIFRPSLIFGIGDEFFGDTLKQLVTLPPVIPQIGDGTFPFRPVWIGDVCTAFAQALQRNVTISATYELVGPVEYSFRELLELTRRAANNHKPIIPVPLSLMRLAVPIMQILPNPPITKNQFIMLLAGNTGDPSVATDVFDLEMRPLSDELPHIIQAT
jgi:NADH dehydrogenase